MTKRQTLKRPGGRPVERPQSGRTSSPASLHSGSLAGLASAPAQVPSEGSPAWTHDADLVERAHAQWQFGDWSGLTEIDDQTLCRHPQRIRLALLVAAAHQQLGQMAATRHYALLARRWGGGNAELARWLVGGVHNTLGRAAAALGQTSRAVEHIRTSIASVAPPAVTRLALPVRLGTQCSQLGLPLPDDIDLVARRATAISQPATLTRGAIESLVAAVDDLRLRHDALAAREDGLRGDLMNWRKSVETTVRREVANMTRQVEAHADVHHYLDTGQMLPELHGWAVSADFARHLMELFEARDYDLIVEFGSGASTVLLSLALQRAVRGGRKQVPRLLTFEHHEKYHRQTQGQLEAAGVGTIGHLVLAPLQSYTAPDGRVFPYYACHESLAACARDLAGSRQRLLVIVDGPPAATAPHARFPALPVLLEHFPMARFDLLLDDYQRRDEQEIVGLWLADFNARGFRASAIEIDLEKKGCLVRAARPASANPEPDPTS